jgi:hypothetical protein
MKDLYGVRGGKIQRITQDGSTTIGANPLNNSQLYQYTASSLAVDLRGEFGAVTTWVDGDPVVAMARLDPGDKDGEVETMPTDGDVLRPSYDNAGNLWVVDRATGNEPRLRVRAPDGNVTEIQGSFGGNTPEAFRIAPDGVRVLLVLKQKSTGTVSVQTATIAPNEQNRLVLGNFRPLELPLTDITDATWYQTGLLVAGRAKAGGLRQPWLVNVDGSQPRPIPGASNDFQAKELAANTNIDTFPVVKDTEGRLHWQTKDLGWNGLDEDPPTPIDPVYPG